MHKLPIYAASDFYTRSLRDNPKGRVKVVEVFPPTVDTKMVAEIEPALVIMTPACCAQSLLRQLVEMIVNSPIGG